MKIANIVFETELVNHVRVDYINYINARTEYEMLNITLPTLYVGWQFMKETNPNNSIIINANILSKRIITNSLYWECSFDENKSEHVNGVESFVLQAPDFYFKPIYNYINLDPVFFQLRDVDDLIDILPKNINVMYKYRNDMLYILHGNKISGINLKMFDFFKFNTVEIISRISERSFTVFDDSDGEMYVTQNKIFNNFTALKRYMPILLSK